MQSVVMKKIFLLSVILFIGIISNAQVQSDRFPCQTMHAQFDSAATFPLPGLDTVLRMCQGGNIVFAADGAGQDVFLQNDVQYHQDSTNVQFIWNFGDGISDTGRIVQHNFAHSGVYQAQMFIVDSNQCCSDTLRFSVYISVPPEVAFNFREMYCNADTFFISIGSNAADNIIIQTPSANMNDFVFNTDTFLFIPDGPYCLPTTTEIPFSVDNGNGAILLGSDDIRSFCIIAEHSFPGDLAFSLTCPDGTEVVLDSYDNSGGSDMGIPGLVDGFPECDSAANPPGTGWLYCWSDYYPQQGTLNVLDGGTSPIMPTDTILNNNYLTSENPFSNFVTGGCHLNGTWILSVTDEWGMDNGYLFGIQLRLKGNQDSLIVSLADTTLSGPGMIQASNGDWMITGIATGTYLYTIVLTDSSGCAYSFDFPVTFIDNDFGTEITGNPTPDAFTLESYTTAAHEGAAYQWQAIHGNIVSGQGTDSLTVLWQYGNTGSLIVTETIGSCTDQDTIEITILGSEEFESKTYLSVFPNPADAMLTVQALKDVLDVEVINSVGATTGIYMSKLQCGETFSFSVESLSSGMYIIVFKAADAEYKLRFIRK